MHKALLVCICSPTQAALGHGGPAHPSSGPPTPQNLHHTQAVWWAISNFRRHLANFSDPTTTNSCRFCPGSNFTVALRVERWIIWLQGETGACVSACFANQFASPQRYPLLPKTYSFTRNVAAFVFAMSEGKVHADVISPSGVIWACKKNNCRGHAMSPREPFCHGPWQRLK